MEEQPTPNQRVFVSRSKLTPSTEGRHTLDGGRGKTKASVESIILLKTQAMGTRLTGPSLMLLKFMPYDSVS